MRKIIVTAFAACAVVMSGLVTPVAYADDYSFMKSQTLQQSVLRAQMPSTLGAWEQYFYFDESGAQFTRPTVCWGKTGPILLPRAKVVGSVNYQVNPNINGSVSIFQYPNQMSADSALQAIRTAKCDGEPLVPTEEETMIKGEQGFDQTDDTLTGLASSLTYIDGDVRGYVSTHTTQRGLAIIATQVRTFYKSPQTLKQQQYQLSRVGNVNNKWHPRVLEAYEAFGQGNAR